MSDQQDVRSVLKEVREKLHDIANVDLYALTSLLPDVEADLETEIVFTMKTTLQPKGEDGTRYRSQVVEFLVNGSKPEQLTWPVVLLVAHRLVIGAYQILKPSDVPLR